jgi:hypothetical protein
VSERFVGLERDDAEAQHQGYVINLRMRRAPSNGGFELYPEMSKSPTTAVSFATASSLGLVSYPRAERRPLRE